MYTLYYIYTHINPVMSRDPIGIRLGFWPYVADVWPCKYLRKNVLSLVRMTIFRFCNLGASWDGGNYPNSWLIIEKKH